MASASSKSGPFVHIFPVYTSRGQVLEKVVEYLQWHARYAQHDQYPIKEFERKIPPELALEL